MTFRSETLPNGLQVIAECNPHALSTAIGFFVRAGSRDETPQLAGVSHFLEHMAFKGTADRSADDMNRLFDEIGAKYNAYTTEEHTVFYAAVLPEYLSEAVDLLADLLRPTLRTEDFEVEKKVILEEIGMYADSPMWSAYERAMRLFFMDHPLGNSVLGTRQSIEALSPEAMRAHHQSRYGPSNLFVAAAGKLDWDNYLELVTDKCGSWAPAPAERGLVTTHRSGEGELQASDRFAQENVFLVLPAPPVSDTLRFAAELLAVIIGDEFGSRFHWALSEPGKTESVDFGYHEYEEQGVYMTSASCDPALAEENVDTILRILDEVTRDGIRGEELEQARNKLGTRIVLSGERPQNRLSSLGYNWSYRREFRTIADDLADLEAVSVERIAELLEAYPLRRPTIVAVGPLQSLAGLAAEAPAVGSSS